MALGFREFSNSPVAILWQWAKISLSEILKITAFNRLYDKQVCPFVSPTNFHQLEVILIGCLTKDVLCHT